MTTKKRVNIQVATLKVRIGIAVASKDTDGVHSGLNKAGWHSA